jgi:hypothetical protein
MESFWDESTEKHKKRERDEEGEEKSQETFDEPKSKKKKEQWTKPPKKRSGKELPNERTKKKTKDGDQDEGPEEPQADSKEECKAEKKESEKEESEAENRTTIVDGEQMTKLMAQSRLVFCQVGGGKSSDAGDAAFLSPHNSRRMLAIDLGNGSHQTTTATNLREREFKKDPSSDESDWTTDEEAMTSKWEEGVEETSRSPKTFLEVTHNHDDHVGGDKKKMDTSKFDAVYRGDWASEKKDKATKGKKTKETEGKKTTGKKKNEPVVRNVATSKKTELVSWKEKKDGGLRVHGEAIVPNAPSSETDENQRSLGTLITVNKRGDKEDAEDERVLTILTTGDMTPNQAKGPVTSAVTADKHTPDIIKMPHHGSANNVDVIDPAIVGKKTTILISGYTMTDTEKLRGFLAKAGAGEAFILFETEALAEEFRKIESCRKLEEAGVTLVKNYYVFVTPEGEVKKVATTW